MIRNDDFYPPAKANNPIVPRATRNKGQRITAHVALLAPTCSAMVASTPSWSATAAVTALAVAAAVPLVYFKYRSVVKHEERQQALKLLRKVDLIVGEISVRLMHIENQVEDFIANEGGEDDVTRNEEEQLSTLNSYYHFDSNGNKLKTKWDSYDVDAELERLEHEEDTTSSISNKASSSTTKSSFDKPKLLTAIGGIEHEFEAVLEFLDDIRGDDVVKDSRKTLIAKITTNQFTRIDALRAALA